MIESQLELVKILCAYITDVYYVRKQSDFSSFVYDAIGTNLRGDPGRLSVIWTKSKYCYQIPGIFLNSPVYMFRPIKLKEGDSSVFISPMSALVLYYHRLAPNSEAMKQLKLLVNLTMLMNA